jgi:hypothetical protein
MAQASRSVFPLAMLGWSALVVGAAIENLPFLGLGSVLLIPGSVVVLLIAQSRLAGGEPHRLGDALTQLGTLLIAGVCVWAGLVGSAALLAAKRGLGDGSAGPLVWVALAACNAIAVGILAYGRHIRRTDGRLTVLIGLAPSAALVVLWVASRFLPLSA